MPIPQTRRELLSQIEVEFQKLDAELRGVDAEFAGEICVDDWSIKDLLAVRLWWTRSVITWVEKGKEGIVPVTPARGYRWKETPRLNADIVNKSQGRSYKSIVAALRRQYSRLLSVIDDLTEDELLEIGMFEWAGRYPVSRWLSINTTRQYHTARSYIRRVRKQAVANVTDTS